MNLSSSGLSSRPWRWRRRRGRLGISERREKGNREGMERLRAGEAPSFLSPSFLFFDYRHSRAMEADKEGRGFKEGEGEGFGARFMDC